MAKYDPILKKALDCTVVLLLVGSYLMMAPYRAFAAKSPSSAGITDPEADFDHDGLTNAKEAEIATDPKNPDTDGDGAVDSSEAVPTDPDFKFPRVPETQYAIINLGEDSYPIAINDNGQALIQFRTATGWWQALWSNGQITHIPFSENGWQTDQGILPYLANDGTVVRKAIGLSGTDNDILSWSPSAGIQTKVDVAESDTTEIGTGYGATAYYLSPNGNVYYDSIISEWNRIPNDEHGILDNVKIDSKGVDLTASQHNISMEELYFGGPVIDDVVRKQSETGKSERVIAVAKSGTNVKLIHEQIEFQDCNWTEKDPSKWGVYTYYSGAVIKRLMLNERVLASGSMSYEDYYGGEVYPGGYTLSPPVDRTATAIAMLPQLSGSTQTVYVGTKGNQVACAWIDNGGIGTEKPFYRDYRHTLPLYENAAAINKRGEVLFSGGARLWKNNHLVDLRGYINAPNEVYIDFKKINNNGMILARSTAASSGASRAVLLIPVELKDIKKTADANDDVNIEDIGPKKPGETDNEYIQRPLSDKQIAYIEPHGATNNTDPEMPHLMVKMPGPHGLKVKYKLLVEYKRGNGYRASYVQDFTRPEDTVKIPANGQYTAEMDADQEWRIFETQDWTNEIAQNGSFGGTAKLYVWFPSQGAEPTEPFITFRIGGKNPDQAKAKTFINSLAGSTFWYAYAIAKHETYGRVRGNGAIRFYNQFYTSYKGGPIGDASVDMGWAAWAKAWPLYNLDRGKKMVCVIRTAPADMECIS